MAAIIGFGVSAVVGLLAGGMGKSGVKSAARAEIRRIRMQTAEEIRRRTGAFELEKKQAVALAGATGFAKGNVTEGAMASGGFGTVLEGMQKEFTAEVDWLNKSAQAGIDVTRAESKRTIGSINAATISNIASSFTRYGEAKNWWA
jgi:hypothetical protein